VTQEGQPIGSRAARGPDRSRELTSAALRAAFVPFFYLVASCFTLQSFLTHWGGAMAVELDAILTLSAPRPYVYRILSPLLVRGVASLIPPRLGTALIAGWGHGVMGLAVGHAGCAGPPSLPFLVATWWMLGALWGTAMVWRALVRWALPDRPWISDSFPPMAVLMLPATFTGGGFLYDFPELLLVSACFWALVQRKWGFFYALLPLAVLNKEASVILLSWWLGFRGALPRRAWWTHAVVSTAIGGAVVLALWWALRDRPGYVAQPNFAHNLRYWSSLRWVFAYQDAFGTAVPLPVAFNVVNLAVLWGVWSIGEPRVPREVARAFAWSAALVLPLLLLFGFENELRVFAVAVPPLVVLGAGAVDGLYASAISEKRT
jgi:hypothetical protein